MRLPPQRPNEPEWIESQRAERAADRQFGLAFAPMQAALFASSAPVFLIDPSVTSTSVFLLGVAVYGAVIVALGVKVLRPRTRPRTVGRYVVNYVAIAWGCLGALALFGMAISLLADYRATP